MHDFLVHGRAFPQPPHCDPELWLPRLLDHGLRVKLLLGLLLSMKGHGLFYVLLDEGLKQQKKLEQEQDKTSKKRGWEGRAYRK